MDKIHVMRVIIFYLFVVVCTGCFGNEFGFGFVLETLFFDIFVVDALGIFDVGELDVGVLEYKVVFFLVGAVCARLLVLFGVGIVGIVQFEFGGDDKFKSCYADKYLVMYIIYIYLIVYVVVVVGVSDIVVFVWLDVIGVLQIIWQVVVEEIVVQGGSDLSQLFMIVVIYIYVVLGRILDNLLWVVIIDFFFLQLYQCVVVTIVQMILEVLVDVEFV